MIRMATERRAADRAAATLVAAYSWRAGAVRRERAAELRGTAAFAPATVVLELGSIGFRSLELRREAGDFAVHVNGTALFCRGACWMPLDVVSLQADAAAYVETVDAVRAAGMNMLRVCGPTVYESDEFLDLCDRSGVLLWQDFMFANMDYPGENPAWLASVEREVTQQLSRLQGRPALAMLCGNSEVAQQASMAGTARSDWEPPLFESRLAAWAR